MNCTGDTIPKSRARLLGLQELLLGHKHTVTFTASGPVKLWTVGREDFNRLVQQQPDLGLALFREMSATLNTTLQVK